MKTSSRDLLVLLKDDEMSNQAIEQEVEQLNDMLYQVESADSFCVANEIIDMNKFKLVQDMGSLVQLMYETELKPFVFLYNKN